MPASSSSMRMKEAWGVRLRKTSKRYSRTQVHQVLKNDHERTTTFAVALGMAIIPVKDHDRTSRTPLRLLKATPHANQLFAVSTCETN